MPCYKVLIPLDGSAFSRQVFPHVRRLFDPATHELVLLQVAEEPAGVLPRPPRTSMLTGPLLNDGVVFADYQRVIDVELAQHPIYTDQERETAAAALHDQLETDAGPLRRAGYTVTTEVRFGDPAEEISACGADRSVGCVMMATHGETGLRRLVLGSVAERILRSMPVPVVLVRPFEP